MASLEDFASEGCGSIRIVHGFQAQTLSSQTMLFDVRRNGILLFAQRSRNNWTRKGTNVELANFGKLLKVLARQLPQIYNATRLSTFGPA